MLQQIIISKDLAYLGLLIIIALSTVYYNNDNKLLQKDLSNGVPNTEKNYKIVNRSIESAALSSC